MDTCYNQNKIASYNDLKKKLLKNPNAKNRLFFIESRPCIEFWFLLHYSKTDSMRNQCSEAVRDLHKHIKNYKKNEDWAREIYAVLRPKLETAVRNASELNKKPRSPGAQYSYSRVNELYQKLRAL